jgi:D-glycero-D-manno-heptose 1,7-bisphosphate phosphatase
VSIKQKQKLILLDRDGVINFDSDDYIKHEDEWIPIPGSLEMIAELNKNNVKVIIVTNQSGVGRGYYSLETLSAMHDKMARLLSEVGGEISSIYFCPHHPDDHCSCRKPKPGLLNQIEMDYSCSLTGVPFIGDTDKDILLAKHKSCLPILVKTGKGCETENKYPDLIEGISVFANLYDAGSFLLQNRYFED